MTDLVKGGDVAAARSGGEGSNGGQPPEAKAAKRSWTSAFSFRNVGVIYVWIAIIILFSIWAPHTFPTWQTARTVLNQNAIAGLMALALIVPLSAQIFDLSVGNAMGLCNVIVAWLLVEKGVPMIPAILLTLGAGILIGLINATIVIGAKIDSFIGTLATGSLMAAVVSILSNDQSIIGPQLSGNFGDIATTSVQGIAVPVFLMLIVAIGVWYLLRYTVTGRRIYATGFNMDAARLTGIKTGKLRFASLVVSGAVAGVAGVLLCSQVSSGSPEIGPPYLLDAFAAAFLGATQFGGRFNAWGTVVAVLLLGTGKTGLVLVNAPVWAPSMFSGVVLLLALILTNVEQTMQARSWVSAKFKRGSGDGGEAAGPATPAGAKA
jgi:ribose transport system permease protein